MADYQTILYQKQRNAVLITLNRPNALNAMNQDMMNELDARAGGSRTRRGDSRGVLTGAGGAFSVGEDISGDEPETEWPYGIPKNTSLNAAYNKFRDADRKDILDRQLYRWQYPKPIIGAVSGWCFGAASWLALTCHITIAADDAVFGQPQVRHGANTDFIWVALAGFKNALRYSLTGDHVDAQEALRIGLVNEVVPKDQLLETCFQLRRPRRPYVAGDGQDQFANLHHGFGDDGSAQSLDVELGTRRHGAFDQARRIQQTTGRRQEKRRPGRFPARTRRARFNRSRSGRERRKRRKASGNRQYPHLFPPPHRGGGLRRGIEPAQRLND